MSKQLKRKLWTTFSVYTRLKAANNKGFVKCVTCPTKRHWKDGMQAGHFIPGRHNGVLFEETNVHPQCVGCNIFLHGNLIKYYPFMLKTYGQKEINRLERLNKKIIKRDKKWYDEQMGFYKGECRKLLSKKDDRVRAKASKIRKETKS